MTLSEDIAAVSAGFGLGVLVAGWLLPEARLLLFVVAVLVTIGLAAFAFASSHH